MFLKRRRILSEQQQVGDLDIAKKRKVEMEFDNEYRTIRAKAAMHNLFMHSVNYKFNDKRYYMRFL